MGKGYNNYMCKKPFHPGSKANIKRTWMAEQRTENEKKKQDDLKVQYEKEQELYNNRAMVSTESKDKLELNFMYEAPPGAKRERQKEDDEPEYKFEWQRKYNAPREDFAKGNTEIRDQPFGIPVRNVRCIKCHKWGHINTDKECPLFSQASTSSMPATSMDPLELMRQMREDGYNLKQSVLGHHLNPQAANQQLLESEEEDPEKEFLQSLTSKQKHKLLKKLNKQLSKQKKSDSSCSKKRKSKKKHKNKQKSSESESEDDKEKKKAKKVAKKPNNPRSEDVNSTESSRSPAKEQMKKSIEHQHRNSSSSGSSNSEDDRVHERRDKKKSTTSSSKDKCTGVNSCEAKEKQEFLAPKTVRMNSKDMSSGGSNERKSLEVKDKIKVHVKQEVEDSPSKLGSKRNYHDSSSNSGSLSSESDHESHTSKRQKKESISVKVVEPSCSQAQSSSGVEKSAPQHSTEIGITVSECFMNEVNNSLEHPDRFTCSTPPPPAEDESSEKSNIATFLLERKYRGGKDEKFRKINRDRRSPSFKQKYRLT